LAYIPVVLFPLLTEGIMKKFLLCLLAIMALSGAVVVAHPGSAAAFPTNPCDLE